MNTNKPMFGTVVLERACGLVIHTNNLLLIETCSYCEEFCDIMVHLDNSLSDNKCNKHHIEQQEVYSN